MTLRELLLLTRERFWHLSSKDQFELGNWIREVYAAGHKAGMHDNQVLEQALKEWDDEPG